MENPEQQSVENVQNDLNSKNASEFCKEGLDSNKTQTIVEDTAQEINMETNPAEESLNLANQTDLEKVPIENEQSCLC